MATDRDARRAELSEFLPTATDAALEKAVDRWSSMIGVSVPVNEVPRSAVEQLLAALDGRALNMG